MVHNRTPKTGRLIAYFPPYALPRPLPTRFPAGFTFYICRYAVNGAECGLVVNFPPAP